MHHITSIRNDAQNTFRLLNCKRGEDIINKLSKDSYTMLFLLEGSIEIKLSKYTHQNVDSEEFIVFYNPALKSLRCCSDVKMIIHTPPIFITKQFDICIKAFKISSSEPMLIKSFLKTWLKNLCTELAETKEICSHEKEREMSTKLISSVKYGEVYTTYYLCRNF